MDSNIFRVITDLELKLPLYVTSAGGWSNQEAMDRPDGFPDYQWIQTWSGTGQLELKDKTYTVGPGQGIFAVCQGGSPLPSGTRAVDGAMGILQRSAGREHARFLPLRSVTGAVLDQSRLLMEQAARYSNGASRTGSAGKHRMLFPDVSIIAGSVSLRLDFRGAVEAADILNSSDLSLLILPRTMTRPSP